MAHSGSALAASSKMSLAWPYQNECWYLMPRSKRRCAVSLHEVAKWTVPNRWSTSSCATAGGDSETPAASAAPTAMTSDDLIMMASRSLRVGRSRQLVQPSKPATGRQFWPSFAQRARFELGSPICYSAARSVDPRPPMIPRYTRADMAAIWDPQTRYRIWFEIEAHAADAMAELGVIPSSAATTI